MASFAFDDVIVVVGGAQITGFADGDSISLEYQEDSNSLTTGADGEVIFNRLINSSALLTLRLMLSSQGNTIMQAIMAAQSAGGPAVPFAITDGSTGTTHSGVGKIQRPPGGSWQREAQPVEWKMICAHVQSVHLGNTDLF